MFFDVLMNHLSLFKSLQHAIVSHWPYIALKTSTMLLLILATYSLHTTSANNKCSRVETPVLPKYHLVEKCQRSKLGIAAKANFSSLKSCQRLGIEKKGLALNFSPSQEVNHKPMEYTCEILKCAETDGGLSLNNDTRYDYYSLYAKHLPNINSTCVPAAGMFFLLSEKVNFTQAQSQCKNMSGVLAGVISEQRTDSLAQVLIAAGVEFAYVGLKTDNGTAFRSMNGHALECITYRAWAPGHPKRNTNMSCVLLTRQHTWKTTSCQNHYQAICELLPSGPYRRGSMFVKGNDTNQNQVQNRVQHLKK